MTHQEQTGGEALILALILHGVEDMLAIPGIQLNSTAALQLAQTCHRDS